MSTKSNNNDAADILYSNINSLVTVPPQKGEVDNSRHLGITEDSGWYYDQQLGNPFTSVRLMSNKILGATEDKKWVFNDTEGNKYTQQIASAILSEDLQVEVFNAWSDNGIEEMVGNSINTFVKPLAPYAGIISSALKEMRDKQTVNNVAEAIGADPDKNITSTIASVVDKLGKEGGVGQKAINALAKLGNGNFITQGCSFVYYQGSSTNFGNLGMRFTIFPTYSYEVNNNTAEGKYIGVIEQLSLLLPYCMGIIDEVNWDDINDISNGGKTVYEAIRKNVGGNLINKGLDLAEDIVTTSLNVAKSIGADKQLQRFIKWQNAPGGYKIDKPESIDTNFPGTLCLEIGTNYKLEGLVITNMNLVFSKQMVKCPKYFLSGGDILSEPEKAIEPLFCEVTLQLRPITKYSDRSLLKFVQGNIENRGKVATSAIGELKEMADKYKSAFNNQNN